MCKKLKFFYRVLKVIRVHMVLVDLMVCLEKMVCMERKEKMATLVFQVHVVQRDSAIIALDLLEPRVKWVIKEKRYRKTFIFHIHTYIYICICTLFCLSQGPRGKRGRRGPNGYKGEKVNMCLYMLILYGYDFISIQLYL